MSEERIRYVSKMRYEEDSNCLKYLGIKEKHYLNENEAPLRGYGVGATKDIDKVKFPEAFKGWRTKEQELVARIKKILKGHLAQPGNVMVPLAIRNHIDHVIVREASVSSIVQLYQEKNLEAGVIFYEDAYVGLTKEEQHWSDARKIISNCEPIDVVIDLKKKLSLFDFYPSQKNDSLHNAMRDRAEELGSKDKPIERIYKLRMYNIEKILV